MSELQLGSAVAGPMQGQAHPPVLSHPVLGTCLSVLEHSSLSQGGTLPLSVLLLELSLLWALQLPMQAGCPLPVKPVPAGRAAPLVPLQMLC